MLVDVLIIGAGFAGAVVAERIATQLGHSVLVVDKRDHIGGNAYDEYNEHGILVHRYGPHIFHTNSKKVWDYLAQFTEWRPYHHRVLGVIDGKQIPIPFNLNSLYAVFPAGQAAKLERLLIEHYGFGVKVPILQLRNSGDKALCGLAQYIYEKVFYNYTVKQWGLTPEELDPTVTARVPIYISRDDRYFQDTYQGLPAEGYTQLFRRMLAHPKIKVLLKTDYAEVRDAIKCKKLIYTGPLDAFFAYRYGELPYRSLRFKYSTHQAGRFQEVGTVNYPNDYDFTRITEFKYLTGQEHRSTTVAYEYPSGEGDAYYPVLSDETRQLYNKYLSEAKTLADVFFLGRLAEYRYYNMDAVVERALELVEQICKEA